MCVCMCVVLYYDYVVIALLCHYVDVLIWWCAAACSCICVAVILCCYVYIYGVC